jgi:sugar (pentulose or hexulose) kinase
LPLFIGIDLGTSGCRAIAIDDNAALKGEAYTDLPPPERDGHCVQQSPTLWWEAVITVLVELGHQIQTSKVAAICVDATSSTLLIIDQKGDPVSEALMYNDTRAQSQAQTIAGVAPSDSAAQGASSTLAKLLWFKDHGVLHDSARACHQADWILGQLSGEFHLSDINNCLKLGYDPDLRQWPQWLEKLSIPQQALPRVVAPGTKIGSLKPKLCERFNLPSDTAVLAGTTDSTAAFIASGASRMGEAVTCLGSTLVLKILSEQPIFAPECGVYSQPLFDKWLVGGASNSGGAVLLKYFNRAQLKQMTPLLTPERSTGLNYYPLSQNGERFPVNDPDMNPQLSPRPEKDIEFFQAMLEGMAAIEKRGYDLLHSLGAPYPQKVYTNGGGAVNEPWQRIRENKLQIPVTKARHLQAAYGTALIALRSQKTC